MTDKQIRDEALRRVMWQVGSTNNDVTRYVSDAVANQVVRDEGRESAKSQIPKAPIPDGTDETDYVRCPACGGVIGINESNDFGNFCRYCGQAISN